MSCSRPLDPLDVEALAAAGEPPLAPDAEVHARGCPACGAAVQEATRLSEELEALAQAQASAAELADLTERIVRLRPFSKRERRSFLFWRVPLVLTGGLFAAGFLLLALPGFSMADQAGLGVAALAPLAGLWRSFARWVSEAGRDAPDALEGLSFALRQDISLSLVFLLLLGPALLGLRRVLARARALR